MFCNTRSLAELIFQDLWTVNEQALPIGIHHGSLSRRGAAQGRGGDRRRPAARPGLHRQPRPRRRLGRHRPRRPDGRAEGLSRLLQRIGRANHRLDEPSEAILVPGNRFEYLEARAALDAIDEGELDPRIFRPGALDVLAQHVMAVACAGPFREEELLGEVRGAAPYAGLDAETFSRILGFIESGGYALRAYDRFKRMTRDADRTASGARLAGRHPRFIQQHRMNAGIIVDTPLLDVRFRNGRKLGTVEDYFASTLSVGDTFFFAGLTLEVERMTAPRSSSARPTSRPASRPMSAPGWR